MCVYREKGQKPTQQDVSYWPELEILSFHKQEKRVVWEEASQFSAKEN